MTANLQRYGFRTLEGEYRFAGQLIKAVCEEEAKGQISKWLKKKCGKKNPVPRFSIFPIDESSLLQEVLSLQPVSFATIKRVSQRYDVFGWQYRPVQP